MLTIVFKHKTQATNHTPFVPPNIFAIIAGSKGCRKTNLLLNLVLEDDYLDYGSVHVYCSTLHQPAYQYLMKRYSEMESDIYFSSFLLFISGNFLSAFIFLISFFLLQAISQHIHL